LRIERLAVIVDQHEEGTKSSFIVLSLTHAPARRDPMLPTDSKLLSPVHAEKRKVAAPVLLDMIRARVFGAHGELCVCDVLKIEIRPWEDRDHPNNWVPVLPGHCPEPCLVAILVAAQSVAEDWDIEH
jgi:hypothetical protein